VRAYPLSLRHLEEGFPNREHKLATADAIVYATARHQDADLLTCNRHFEVLANVVFFPKTSND
jgi:hypothetical protein